jgi:hypothetical protein
MGIVIPFPVRQTRHPHVGQPGTGPSSVTAAEQAVIAAMQAGANRQVVLDAAAPLLDRCRDPFGFTVMRKGLPTAPAELGDALLNLARGLALLEAEFGTRSFQTYGVYFGHKELGWFEDGYGGSNALAVPVDVAPADLAQFVRPRLRHARS